MIELYHTRRINHKKCAYYKRDERTSVGDMSMWIAQTKPTGYFYARKINAQMQNNQVLMNVFEVGQTVCTIETNDDIHDIRENDIVMYNDELWTVQAVQQLEHLKETQFSCKEHYTSIISLRK